MERLRKHTTIFYSTHILDDVQRVSDTVVILTRELWPRGDRGGAGLGFSGSFTLTSRRQRGIEPPAQPALGHGLEEMCATPGGLADPGRAASWRAELVSLALAVRCHTL